MGLGVFGGLFMIRLMGLLFFLLNISKLGEYLVLF